MKMFFHIFLTFLISPTTLANLQTYQSTNFPFKVLNQTLFDENKLISSTTLCAARCMTQSYKCDGFFFQPNNCHLINFDDQVTKNFLLINFYVWCFWIKSYALIRLHYLIWIETINYFLKVAQSWPYLNWIPKLKFSNYMDLKLFYTLLLVFWKPKSIRCCSICKLG